MFDPTLYDDRSIAIVGLGNIGSHAALALARMGLKNFRLWDFDEIEAHNVASQAYPLPDTGRKKVHALMDMMLVVNERIVFTPYETECKGEDADVIISAVDTLEARKVLAANSNPESFVIDGRVGGGQLEIYSQYAKDWAATIPNGADEDPCGMRFISYTSYIIAGLIANNVKRHLKRERLAKRIIMHVDTLQSIITYDQ